jgi:uncharacterized protein (DUF1015 family)
MYDPERVDLARVVAPPYDVIGPSDQQRYYGQDPHNVVRLIAGEVRPTDSAEDNKYLRAAGFFEEWLRQGVLRQEAEPSIHVYRHDFLDPTSGNAVTRQGILGVVELEPFGEGILPHERTHARAKADRLSLTRAVRANLSPIFCLYEDPRHQVKRILGPHVDDHPRLSIQTDDGDSHRIWSVRTPGALQALAGALAASRLYVADGHHRYETALNFRNKMRSEHPEAPPDAAFNFVLMLLVDVTDPGLVILPTHRFVHDLAGFDADALIARLEQRFDLTQFGDRQGLLDAMQDDSDGHRLGAVLGSGQFLVDIPRPIDADPVSRLDVSVLHRDILEGAMGLAPAALEEERYVGYSRDLQAVLDRVDSGAAQAAFLLRPPAVSDVVSVAAAGQVMPQKSTYFYPKPASGIVFNPLDPGIRIPAV